MISYIRCFASKKHSERDELKTNRGSRSARDSATNFREAVEEDGDGELESGDEDVLTSLGASYRAWRVYHREKRAHDYTKSRLVATFKREAELLKLLARMGGSVESVEQTLMRLEDLEAAVMILKEKAEVQVIGSAMRKDLSLELEVLNAQCQAYKERLHEANATLLNYRSQNHEAHLKLASSKLEKGRLTGELRMVKKAAVLAMNRQFYQFDAQSHANGNKKRSHSSIGIV